MQKLKLNWINFKENPAWLALVWKRIAWLTLLEVGVITAWAVWVARGYLDFSQFTWPQGDVVPVVTESHYVWTLLTKCGSCMLWNGFINGGSPAFAELMGSVLHPLTVVTTVLFGVNSSIKLLLVASLIMAGLSQWWLAKVMGLGLIPRFLGGIMAVLSGYLIGAMTSGSIPLVFSQACACLILAPAVQLGLTRKRSALILLGITLALTWLSGQGYTEVTVMLAIFPAFLIFMFDARLRLKPVWKDYALALLIAILLTGILWVPLLHFWPNIVKEGDPQLTSYKPMGYMPLNFVVPDWNLYNSPSTILDSYVYIGWVPIILAVLCLRLVPKSGAKLMLFFWTAIGLILLVCSSELVKFVAQYIPQVGYLRLLHVTVGLATPFILAMAMWALDYLLKLNWPKIGLFIPTGRPLTLSLAWVILGIPLLLTMGPNYQVSQGLWKNETYDNPQDLIDAMTPKTAEWIEPTYTEWTWISVLEERGVKLSGVYRAWEWLNRKVPVPYLEGQRNPNNQVIPGSIGNVDNMELVLHPDGEYAYIQSGDKMIPCQATSMGGNIDVSCTSDVSGTLIVHENNWSGWVAWMDGKATPLAYNDWLAVSAPAGSHVYSFRYLPWDVPVGLLITLGGIGFCIWLGRRNAPAAQEIEAVAGDENRANVDSPGDLGYP